MIITAEVNNGGSVKGAYTAELKIDGLAVTKETISVVADASWSVTFIIVQDVPRTYQLDVGGLSRDLIGSRDSVT